MRASDAGLHRLARVILAGMEITGFDWCGTRTDRSRELAHFYEHVLALRPVQMQADFWVFELPDGRNVEVSAATARARSISLPARSSVLLSATCQPRCAS